MLLPLIISATLSAAAVAADAPSIFTATQSFTIVEANQNREDQKKPDDQKPSDQKPSDQKVEAKEPPTPPRTGIRALFGNLVEDVQHLPSKQNLYLTMIGGGLAAAAHPVEQTFNERLRSHYDAVNTAFAPAKYFGDTPEDRKSVV